MVELPFTSESRPRAKTIDPCHVKDFRNLTSQGLRLPSKMDEMKKWEIMNSSPTVEYEADGDGIEGKKPFLRLRVTFYLYEMPDSPS